MLLRKFPSWAVEWFGVGHRDVQDGDGAMARAQPTTAVFAFDTLAF